MGGNLNNKRIKCTICGMEYELDKWCCPKCKFPALSLSSDIEKKTRNMMAVKDEQGFGDVESLFELSRQYDEQGIGDAESLFELSRQYDEQEFGDAESLFELSRQYAEGDDSFKIDSYMKQEEQTKVIKNRVVRVLIPVLLVGILIFALTILLMHFL